MSDVKKPEQEVAELRERVKELEALVAELKARGKKTEGKEKEKDRVTHALETSIDEMNKLSLGFFFAGLESLAIAGDVTRTFVNRTFERNQAEKRDSTTKKMLYLPWDMTEATFDALDEAVGKTEQVVNKFHDTYKES